MAWKKAHPKAPHTPCVSIPWGSQGQMEEWQGTNTPDGPVHHPDAKSYQHCTAHVLASSLALPGGSRRPVPSHRRASPASKVTW